MNVCMESSSGDYEGTVLRGRYIDTVWEDALEAMKQKDNEDNVVVRFATGLKDQDLYKKVADLCGEDDPSSLFPDYMPVSFDEGEIEHVHTVDHSDYAIDFHEINDGFYFKNNQKWSDMTCRDCHLLFEGDRLPRTHQHAYCCQDMFVGKCFCPDGMVCGP